MDRIPSRYHFPSPGFEHYWKHGHGKRLAAPFPNAFATEEEIRLHAPLLLTVDEVADRVVREVLLVHGFPKTHAWIAAGLSGNPPDDMPLSLRELIDFTLRQPDWLDLEQLETGARLCRRSGAKGLIVLRNYCLMGGYESSAINKPLIFTEALKKGPGKRITETTEFWVTVVGETAMQRTEGLKACLVVRLMHAYSRVAILERSDWQTDEWGMPLNHWDMIATNLGFSVVFLNGLRLLGMQPSAEEITGLFHFWKYIGYLLGIPADQLPATEADAVRALYCWTITQPPADEDTKALARALMNEPLNDKFPVKHWQKKRVLQVHLGYNYYFLGARSCAAMGLPVKGWTIYPFLLRNLTRFREVLNGMSPAMMEKSVRTAGRRQKKIVDAFLKGYGKREASIGEAIARLIRNIALGKVLLKYETIELLKPGNSLSNYTATGLLFFQPDGLLFTDKKGNSVRAIPYEEITAIHSKKELFVGGFVRKGMGAFPSLKVTFHLKNGRDFSESILTTLYLEESDRLVEKSPAPSLEKVLKTIYPLYKKIDRGRLDFPEYDEPHFPQM